MLKDKFAVLSVISLLLYAITDFCRNALEIAFRVQLIIGSVNHSSSDWAISSKTCQQVLLTLATVCLIISIMNTIIDAMQKRKKSNIVSGQRDYQQQLCPVLLFNYFQKIQITHTFSAAVLDQRIAKPIVQRLCANKFDQILHIKGRYYK